jgi:phosphotransferase system enzyme I (PtsI)
MKVAERARQRRRGAPTPPPVEAAAPEAVFAGAGVSDGVAIGRAVVIETRGADIYRFPIEEADVDAEVDRLHAAVRRARQEIRHTSGEVDRQLGSELAAIFEAHALLLGDDAFLGKIERRVRSERVNAEWAVHRTAEELAERFAQLDAAHLRERGQDVIDVAGHLLRALQGIDHHDLAELGDDVIIIADDITPSEAVRLGRQRVAGFAVESGGRTSHTTIIARSLGIPAVIGLSEVTSLVTDNDLVIVDGRNGQLLLHPTEETLARYRTLQRELQEAERALEELRDLEAVTPDGQRVELMANVDLPEELAEVGRYGAAGIGLYRSEFLYIEKYPNVPTEDEHYAIYRQVVEAAAPCPAIIRTYDLGGRKIARELMHTREDNPVLGLRGVRLLLARRQLFEPQLRGLLRAAAHGELWIMVPMVTTVEEVRAFRALVEETRQSLLADRVPLGAAPRLGVMIEVPSAALIADILAREVDFFSIGTNDLTQYSLAVDRNNEQVQSLYQPLHPALVRMLRFVVASARDAGIEVSMCGELAGDPRVVPLLLGLGLRRLSVNPRQIPQVKTQIRLTSTAGLDQLLEQCAALATAAEVEQLLAKPRPLVASPGRKAARKRTGTSTRRKAQREDSRAPGGEAVGV